MLVLAPQVTQAVNDKQQIGPMLERVQALPTGLNQPEQLLADTGYCSADNVAACEQAGIEPLIAVKRDHHHPHWAERFREPDELPDNPTPVERMTHRLKTGDGRAAYALRKQRVEPVFGIIKSVLGLPPVPHPRSGQRPGRVDPGVPGVEFSVTTWTPVSSRHSPRWWRARSCPTTPSGPTPRRWGWPRPWAVRCPRRSWAACSSVSTARGTAGRTAATK